MSLVLLSISADLITVYGFLKNSYKRVVTIITNRKKKPIEFKYNSHSCFIRRRSLFVATNDLIKEKYANLYKSSFKPRRGLFATV